MIKGSNLNGDLIKWETKCLSVIRCASHCQLYFFEPGNIWLHKLPAYLDLLVNDRYGTTKILAYTQLCAVVLEIPQYMNQDPGTRTQPRNLLLFVEKRFRTKVSDILQNRRGNAHRAAANLRGELQFRERLKGSFVTFVIR